MKNKLKFQKCKVLDEIIEKKTKKCKKPLTNSQKLYTISNSEKKSVTMCKKEWRISAMTAYKDLTKE